MADFKIFYASDVHGSERCFLKFVNAGKFYGANALILGGDLTGKLLVPIIKTATGWSCFFLGKTEALTTQAEVAEMEKRVRMNGHYPYVCDQGEFDRLEANPAYRQQVFDEQMKASVERWVAIADERLKGTSIACSIIPGNDDGFFLDPMIQGTVVRNHDQNVVNLGDFQLVGSSWANPTPWRSPREMPEERFEAHLQAAVSKVTVSPDRLILNFHVPPYQTGLDTAPEVRPDLSVVMQGGQPKLIPVGSHAVRRVVERVQPLLSLHGHIHESRGTAKIGRTLCLNAGSDYGDGVLRGAIITVRPGKVVSHQLISG